MGVQDASSGSPATRPCDVCRRSVRRLRDAALTKTAGQTRWLTNTCAYKGLAGFRHRSDRSHALARHGPGGAGRWAGAALRSGLADFGVCSRRFEPGHAEGHADRVTGYDRRSRVVAERREGVGPQGDAQRGAGPYDMGAVA